METMKLYFTKLCLAAVLCVPLIWPDRLCAVTVYRITINTSQYPETDDNQQALLVMIQALQGIVNRTCSDKIWYQWQTHAVFMSWVQSNYGVTFIDTYASNPWGLLNHFKNQAGISQYIVYNLYDGSQNVARSLSGVMNAIPVTAAWVATAQSHGLTQALDVRGRNESWMYTNYWSSFNPHGLIEQYEGHPCQQFLGDWATFRKYFMYYEGNTTFRHTINAAAIDHSLNYGWGMDEFNWVQDCSENNITPVVANFSENFSLLSQLGNKRAAQKAAVHASPSLMPQAGKHYVAIVMSDGDNIQWMQRNFLWPNWWGNSHRGQFKMNWEMNATCLDACPPVIQYYYNSATNNDFFVSGPSGTSYMFPRDYPDKDGYVDKMNNFIREADLHVVSVLNNGTNKSNCDKWAQAEETLGVIYKQYANYYKGTAGIRWVSGKPIKGYDYSMWEGSGTPASASEIAEAINARPTNPTTDQNSYSLVNVHAWSYWGGDGAGSSVMDNVYLLVTSLDSDVEVVTAEEMLIMLRNQFGTPVTTTDNTWTYQAEYMSHDIGRADNDGWSANVAQDAPGHMSRGISLNTVTGSARAYFSLMIDVLNAGNDKVVTCEIYDSTASTLLASKDVYRWNFSSDFMYKEIRVDFTATAGHAYDFRVYWWDTSYVRQDYVRIVGTASSSDLPPVIVEVVPDPDNAKTGTPYTKQLTLLQGNPIPTWSVITGPAGIQVGNGEDNAGYVSGWTPTSEQIGQTLTITIRATNAVGHDDETWQVTVFSAADFDLDGDVDLVDFGFLQNCYSGNNIPYSTGCQQADLDKDNDVDQTDFTQFKNCLGGADRPPGC